MHLLGKKLWLIKQEKLAVAILIWCHAVKIVPAIEVLQEIPQRR
jgi:hypothetical protein